MQLLQLQSEISTHSAALHPKQGLGERRVAVSPEWLMPDWWSAFVTLNASSPPVPFGFCIFFQLRSDSTRPENRRQWTEWSILVRPSWRRLFSCVLLGCWRTRTCPLLPSGHKPPGSPFVCPSELPDPGWEIWLVLCHKRTVYSNIDLWILPQRFRNRTAVAPSVQPRSGLTVCGRGDCAGPGWRVHARPSWSLWRRWAMLWVDFPSFPQPIHQTAADWKEKVCSYKCFHICYWTMVQKKVISQEKDWISKATYASFMLNSLVITKWDGN